MKRVLRSTLLGIAAAAIGLAQTSSSITSLNPSSAVAGGPGFTLTVNGFGFFQCTSAPCLGVNWTPTSGSASFLPATSTSGQGTSFTVSVPASLIAVPDSIVITARTAGGTTGAVQFAVTAPTPVIGSLAPPSATAGGPSFTLTLNGSGFYQCPRACLAVNWQSPNGSATLAASGTPNSITVTVPANLISGPGTAGISVSAAGGTSNTVSFPITMPAPAIASLSPAALPAGSPAFTLTVNGSNFMQTAVVSWNGTPLSTSYGSSGQLMATVPATLLSTPGTASVTVVNPNQTASNAAAFSVLAPVITFLNPFMIMEGSNGFTLTVTGSNFVSGSVVYFGSTALPTSFISATQLTAPVTADLIIDAQTIGVIVRNTTSAASAPFGFTVTPAPLVINTLQPVAAVAGGPAFTLTVFGSGFKDGSTVLWNGAPLSTSLLSPTRLSAAVPANLIAQKSVAVISVRNPNQALSNTLPFNINVAGPTISSLNPASLPAGSDAFTLTVNGTGFLSGASVLWSGTTLTTVFVSATQVTASVPANLVATEGLAAVSLTNPDGNSSNTVNFTIGPPPPPTITSLSPATGSAGGPAFNLTVNGTGFLSGAAVQWNGTPLSTTFVSRSQLTASVPASLIAQTGSASITVVNPNRALSNSVQFAIGVPPPVITSLDPSVAGANSPAFTMTVTGSGFVSGSTVQWGGVDLSSTLVNATQLRAAVPASLLQSAGTPAIRVINPNGAISNQVVFTVRSGPVITSLSPGAADAAGPAFTLTVNGSGFASGAAVQWNGTALATTFGTAARLTAAVPASLLANPGPVPVVVLNPNGDSSNTVSFSVTIPAPPTISFTGPATAGPLQQPKIDFTLNNPYPFPITGQATLTFKPNTVTPVDTDPAILFVAGGLTYNFTIGPNSSTVPSIAIQTGSTAGTITVSMKLQSLGQDIKVPDVVIQVARAAPVIRSVKLTRSGSSLQVEVVGYATPREVTQATFHFTAGSGVTLQTADFTVPAATLFGAWYGDKNSNPYGTQFTYVQPFTLVGDANNIASVGVTLTNSAGASQQVTGN